MLSIDTELFTFPVLPVFPPTCSFFHTASFHEWSWPTRLFISQPSPGSYSFGSQNCRIFLNAGGSPLPLALSHAVPCVRFSSSSLFFYAFFGCLTCSKALQGSPQIALPFPNLRCLTLPSYSGLSALSHHLLKLLLLCFPARRWLMCPLGSVWRQTLSSTSLRIWKLWRVLGMWNPQQCLRRAEEVFLQDIWVNVLRW